MNQLPHFNLSSSFLIASLWWGSVGFAFSLFGWRQKEAVPLVGGIAMMALSYMVSSALYMSLASIALIGGIFWLRRRL